MWRKRVIPYLSAVGGDQFAIHFFGLDYPTILMLVRPIRPITSFIVFRQCDFTMQGIDAVLKVCACISIYHCITFARDGVDGQPSLVPNIHYRRVFFAGDVIMLNKKTCIFSEVEIGLLF